MKIKHYSLALVLALLPGVVLAANEVTLTADVTNIVVDGITLTVATTGTVDSITVDSDNSTVTISAAGSLSITSADRRILGISTQAAAVSSTCSNSANTYTVSAPTTQETITVRVSANTCTTPVTGSGGSGGGGGGGGGSASGAGVTTYYSTPQAAAAASATTGDAKPTVTPAQIVPSALAPGVVGATVRSIVSPVFNRALKIGQKHPDVLRLQQLLNSDQETMISASGAGSPGKETNLYGPATKRAVEKFQLKYKLAKKGDVGFGNFGPKTRAKLNEVFGESAVSTEGQVSAQADLPSTPQARAALIKTLQEKLVMLMQELLKLQKPSN